MVDCKYVDVIDLKLKGILFNNLGSAIENSVIKLHVKLVQFNIL